MPVKLKDITKKHVKDFADYCRDTMEPNSSSYDKFITDDINYICHRLWNKISELQKKKSVIKDRDLIKLADRIHRAQKRNYKYGDPIDPEAHVSRAWIDFIAYIDIETRICIAPGQLYWSKEG